jgi:formamidopyrimidine-DNA glycosylase
MPELPEVETIRRALVKPLEGRRITAAELKLPRLLLGFPAEDLPRRLKGQRIGAVIRRGKYLILELDKDSLVIHLGMTGQLTHAAPDAPVDARFRRTLTGLQKPYGAHPVDKHTHLLLHLDNGSTGSPGSGGKLMFRDPRTFGKILLVPGKTWADHPRLGKLGPEPLTMKPSVHAKNIAATSMRPVKALLLDQEFLAGVGNIYADEALFLSGIHPKRLVKSLEGPEKITLLEAVKTVLRKGIRYQGTTFSDYRQPDGTSGNNFERLQVYGRGGKPCRACGTTLEKIVVAQRGTVFCPACQPINRTTVRRRRITANTKPKNKAN